jgi:hypothetical protein
MLDGIYKFLAYVNENWTMICAILVLIGAIYKKAQNFFSKSQEEKIEIAKAQINEIMLMLVTQAECDYYQWLQAGEIKRAQVIDEVFAMYPILSKVTNQAEIIAWIDEAIDNALKTMRKIFEENKEAEKAE